MRDTTSPMFRDYYPELTDYELQKRGRILRHELTARVVQRGESLDSRRCRELRRALDDMETTVAYRKLNNQRRKP